MHATQTHNARLTRQTVKSTTPHSAHPATITRWLPQHNPPLHCRQFQEAGSQERQRAAPPGKLKRALLSLHPCCASAPSLCHRPHHAQCPALCSQGLQLRCARSLTSVLVLVDLQAHSLVAKKNQVVSYDHHACKLASMAAHWRVVQVLPRKSAVRDTNSSLPLFRMPCTLAVFFLFVATAADRWVAQWLVCLPPCPDYVLQPWIPDVALASPCKRASVRHTSRASHSALVGVRTSRMGMAAADLGDLQIQLNFACVRSSAAAAASAQHAIPSGVPATLEAARSERPE